MLNHKMPHVSDDRVVNQLYHPKTPYCLKTGGTRKTCSEVLHVKSLPVENVFQQWLSAPGPAELIYSSQELVL